MPVIAYRHDARFLHLPHLGQRLAGEPFRGRADREHMDHAFLARPAQDEFRDGGAVVHRIRVGHTGHAREAAGRGCASSVEAMPGEDSCS